MLAGDADVMDEDRRVLAWERRTEWPLITAAALFIAAYTVQVLDTDLSPGWWAFWRSVTFVTWALYVIDYLARLMLSSDRMRFVRTRWLDLVVLVMPLLRPLRVVQIYAMTRERVARPRLSAEAQVALYAGLTTLLTGYSASLAVYRDERNAPGATIRTFGDAVWWACVTVTSVGYGDMYPVTPGGRVVGVVLMLVGIGLLGAVVGTFSSLLVQHFERSVAERRPPEDE